MVIGFHLATPTNRKCEFLSLFFLFDHFGLCVNVWYIFLQKRKILLFYVTRDACLIVAILSSQKSKSFTVSNENKYRMIETSIIYFCSKQYVHHFPIASYAWYKERYRGVTREEQMIQPCLKCGKNTMTNFYCCSNEYRWNFKYQAEMQECVSFVWVWRVICVTSITLKFNQINHGQARHVLHSARFSKALMYCYASEILVNFEFEWLHPFSSMDSGQVRFTSSHHEQTLPFHMDL